MTSYIRTMREAREEMLQSIHEANVIDKVKDIVKRKSAAKIDGVLVDLFTASAISQIYDKVNPMNKKKMERLPIKKLASAAMRVMDKNEYVPEDMTVTASTDGGISQRDLDYVQKELRKLGIRDAVVDQNEMDRNKIDVKTRMSDDKVKRAFDKSKMTVNYEHVDLDEGTKQVLAHGGKGQYKAVRDGDITKVMYKGKVVGTADFDSGADSFFVSMKGVKGQKSFDDAQAMVDYFAKNKITEEVELDEEFKKGDKVTVKVAKSSDREIQQLSKKFGDTVSGVVMGQSGKILMVKTDKGQINPPVKDVMKEEVELDEKLDKEDEPKVKEIIKKLKGASQAHAGQAKDLQKAVTEKDELDEAVDKNAADELKMYIENDAQLYKSQLIPIVKNMQRKMKSGKYDHRKAPKLWMYLVDAGAKKYVKEFGGDVRNMFDKQTRQYVAQQMADEYKNEIEAQGGTMFEEVGMDEAYSPKQIKMAIGIASDPRYKGGNYSGAVKAIEKIKGGLSQHKQVAAVLKRQNEALGENLDGRTREYRQHRERLESLRAKRLEARHIDPADIDTSATDDDIKAADKNIMMQLRKSVSLRGQYSVEFLDKKKVKVPQKIALAVIAKYNSLRKPMDKEKFQAKVAKSHRDLLMGLKENLDEKKKKKPVVFKGTPKQIKQQMKNLKKKDKIKIGEESTLDRMNKKLQEKKNG